MTKKKCAADPFCSGLWNFHVFAAQRPFSHYRVRDHCFADFHSEAYPNPGASCNRADLHRIHAQFEYSTLRPVQNRRRFPHAGRKFHQKLSSGRPMIFPKA